MIIHSGGRVDWISSIKPSGVSSSRRKTTSKVSSVVSVRFSLSLISGDSIRKPILLLESKLQRPFRRSFIKNNDEMSIRRLMSLCVIYAAAVLLAEEIASMLFRIARSGNDSPQLKHSAVNRNLSFTIVRRVRRLSGIW